jgi:hypothetical protein
LSEISEKNMKIVYGVVLLATLFALAHGFPGAARDSAESTEDKSGQDGVVLVVPSRSRIFEDMDDDDEPSMPGFWHPFRFDSSPFDSMFTRMQEAMNRIRNEMATALSSRFPQGLTPWGKVPEGANTTSTTKIIGDHAVTINETTYTDGDENGGTVFRIRVVDVKPLNETTDAVGTERPDNSDEDEAPTRRVPDERNNEEREELTTPGSRSVETVEEFDNEIPKNQVDTLTA